MVFVLTVHEEPFAVFETLRNSTEREMGISCVSLQPPVALLDEPFEQGPEKVADYN